MDMGETRFVTVYGFQSTLSVRRATDLVISPDFVQDISIHALRKESDPALQPLMGALQFQSTLSVRRATISSCTASILLVISIHALRKESDSSSLPMTFIIDRFQSTLSVRRATIPNRRAICVVLFQSTLSVRRATRPPTSATRSGRYFNPRSP